MSKSAISKLNTQRNKLTKQIGKLQHIIDEKVASKYVGKFYRFKDSRPCPKSDSDYWYIYYRIDKSENGRLLGVSFSIDVYKNIEIKNERLPLGFMSNLEEINKHVYSVARNDIEYQIRNTISYDL